MKREMDELKAELAKPIAAVVDWLAPRLPAWVDRLPSPPKWMGLMFWIYAAVAVEFIAIMVKFGERFVGR